MPMTSSPLPSISECLFATFAFIAWYVGPKWLAISLIIAVALLWYLRGVADNFARDITEQVMHPERHGFLLVLRGVVWSFAAALVATMFFARR